VKLLLDTHVILWALDQPERLSPRIVALLEDEQNDLFFSVATLWEVAIKNGTRRSFQVDLERLRRGLLTNGYGELSILAEHAMLVATLPSIHRDPFDRILVAQAQYEGMTLVTQDRVLSQYRSEPL
jgi:PIN domain nuclease of toxin-antitoxin system